MATTAATPREMSEAHWAFKRRPPSSTNSDSSGRTAKIDEVPSEWDTGSRTCLYTPLPSVPPSRDDSLRTVPDGERAAHQVRIVAWLIVRRQYSPHTRACRRTRADAHATFLP